MNATLNQAIRGSHHRKTRFHDEKGNLVDFAGLCYAPVALGGAILRRLFRYRPVKPTLSFRATKVIEQLLQPDWNCAEFGSGMSTVWLGKRCGYLLSVENDQVWFEDTQNRLNQSGCGHVQYELRTSEQFSDLSMIEDGFFSFALIDGWDRAGCVEAVLPKMKSGGWIYLDNSDKDMGKPDGDLRRAENLLLDYVRVNNKHHEYFVDFSRTNFFVEQGLLAQA